MKKIYGLLLGGALTLSLAGVISVSSNKTEVKETHAAVNVSSVDQLKSALASATSETEIVVSQKLVLNPDDFSSTSYVLDGKGATVRVPTPFLNENMNYNANPSNFGVFQIDGGSNPLTIKNMTIMGGKSETGIQVNQWLGAVQVTTGQVVTFDNCNFTQSNGGLSLNNQNGNSKVIVKNSNFSKNISYSGGALKTSSGTLVVDGCSFVSNCTYYRDGGAIALVSNRNGDKHTVAYINNSVFANNTASAASVGGAIHKKWGSKLYLMNSTITGNASNYVYYDEDDITYSGAVALNGYNDGTNTTFYSVNNAIVDNYITGKENTNVDRTDISQENYREFRMNILNNLYGKLFQSEDATNTIKNCKESLDNTFAYCYENISNVYKNDSTGYDDKYTAAFSHPKIVQNGDNAYSYYVPASRKGPAATGGIKTYFDYDAFPTVKMGYGEPSSITALGDLEAPASGKRVTKYFEGTTRADGVIGACGLAPKDYYYIDKGNVTNGTMTGIPDEGANYIEGTSFTLQATPNEGYGFKYWSISNSEDKPTDNPYTFTPTGSATVTPVFGKIVNVAYNLNGGTGTTPTTEQVISGDSITTAASTGFSRPGYTFVCWNTKSDGKGTNVNAETSYTVNAATTLFAKWSANNYDVTLDHNNGTGETTVVNATFDANMPTVTPPTKDGFVFDGYYDELEGGTKYYNANGTSAKKWDKASAETLYAHWVYQILYTKANFDGDYDGQPHTISVSVSDPVENYTIKYGTSASSITLDEAPTYTDVKKNEAAYQVFFKIEAEGYRTVVDSATVTLHKVAAQSVTPTAKENLYYTGENIELLNECSSTEGTVQYSSTEEGTYSANIPTGLEIGEYEIFYKVVGDGNHTDSEVKSMKVSILENDKTALNKAIENGDKLHELIKDNYPEIDGSLATALTKGKEVKESATALAKDITDATTKINEACVNAIEKLVESIGEIKNDEQSKESVDLARAAYESLSDEQKLLVPQKTLADLEAKEAEYKKVSSGLAWWAIALIVVVCLAVVIVLLYVLMFYVFHKWIKQDKKAIKVFKCGHKHGKARLFTKSLKVMYRFDEEVFKTKEEALK